MRAVSDTSSINYLILIEVIDVLPHLFGEIGIPRGVFRELSHPDAPNRVQQWCNALPPWMKVVDVRGVADGSMLRLHRGELESILLAEHAESEFLLLDDMDARAIARQRGLHVIGTIGVLNEAGYRGLIDVRECVERLQLTSFRAGPEMYKWLLDQHAS